MIHKLFRTYITLIFPWLILTIPLPADEVKDDYFDLSFEELSKIVVSVSNYEEPVFKAPMAATVISADQIKQSGATSIPEALRLVPGVIVREQTSGNYDVHVRGLDNVPPGSVVQYSVNNLTLVMIDGRSVYDHFTGGVFWDSMPIGVHDVERIEVVKGAASAMHGPNAVTGVIHIITKNPRTSKRGLSTSLQGGSNQTVLSGIDYSDDINDAWSYRLSSNWEQRDRADERYFNYTRNAYVLDVNDLNFAVDGSAVSNPQLTYPEQELGIERFGLNFQLAGDLPSGEKIDLAVGYQDSKSQKIYEDNAITPITHNETESYYANLNIDWGVWDSHLSYDAGDYEVVSTPFFSYKSQSVDFSQEAQYHFDDFKLQPHFGYRHQQAKGMFASADPFNGKTAEVDIYSLGLRTEYELDRLTLTAAWRGEHYDFSNGNEHSFFTSAAYSLSDSVFLRASYGRAHQEPFLLYSFNDTEFVNAPLRVKGNQELDLITVDNYEFGARWYYDRSLFFDLELFSLKVDNYQDVFSAGTFSNDSTPKLILQYQNLDTQAELNGATVSVAYSKDLWDASVFLTLQRTDIDNLTTKNADLTLASAQDLEHVSTPQYYGGFSLSFTGIERLNLNLNGYYFDSFRQDNFYSNSAAIDRNVNRKMILNTKVNYDLSDSTDVFLTVQNLLDDKDNEVALSDRNGVRAFVGINWGFGN